MTGSIVRSKRLKDRRRTVRRNRFRTILRRATALTIAGGVVTAGVAIAGSSLFALGGVEVSGARSVTSDHVREIARLPIGANVLTLDLDGARRRVEAIPEVRSAEIDRVGAVKVRITIVERTPAVLVRVGTAKRYFDIDGVEVRGPVRGRVPVVRIPATTRAIADGRVLEVQPHPDRPLIETVLRVWRAAGDLRGEISRFEAMSDGLVMVVGRTRVELGALRDRSEVVAKVSALRAITSWAATHNQEVRSIDVRVPEHPAMRLA